MQSNDKMPETMADDLARECLYRYLALALSDPHSSEWQAILDSDNQRLACQSADLLRADAECTTAALGFGELSPQHLDLRPVVNELRKPLADIRDDYNRVFGLVPARECPPYETEYHSSVETFFRSQQLADIAGFYRAFGIEPGREAAERPDYLPLELQFMAFLLLKKRLAAVDGDTGAEEHARICAETECTFFREHLAWWAPSFAAGLRRKAAEGLYDHLASLLAAFLTIERQRFELPPPRVPLQPAIIERPEEQADCAACSASV